jgi:hypothetical protein
LKREGFNEGFGLGVAAVGVVEELKGEFGE